MTPIFAVPSQRTQPQPAVAGTKDPSRVHTPKTKAEEAKTKEANKPLKPVKDEYLPEEKREPSGRYWMENGENGQKKIHFDAPQKEKAPEPDAENPDKAKKADDPDKDSKKPEICKGNNDKAEREIKKLKEKKKTLEQQIRTETDEVKIKKLEQKLAQVENELRQKDNDGYLRRNTVFT